MDKQSEAYFDIYFRDIDFDDLSNSLFNKVNNHEGENNKSKNLDICITCGKEHIVEDYSNGIIVCTKCGQILNNIYDCSPEWKHYEDDDKNVGRCGFPINKLLPQSSLGTSINCIGNSRLKLLHSWIAMPTKERSLNNVFMMMQTKCSQNGILKCVVDDAKIMYKTISECKHLEGKNKDKNVITRGINRRSIIAACVFYACKRKGMTRTPKEIGTMFDVEAIDINRGSKNFLKMMKLKNFDMNMRMSSSTHFVKRYCDELHIKTVYTNKAIQIANNVEKLNIITSHTPYSLAAAVILIMAEINNLTNITRKHLATHFNVSEITIIKTHKKIEAYKDIIIDDEKTNKYIANTTTQADKIEISQEILDRMAEFGISTNMFVPKDNEDTYDIIDDDNDDIDIVDDEDCSDE